MPFAEGATATNPQTGQKAVMKGGKWYVIGSPQMLDSLPEADKKTLGELQQDVMIKQELSRRADQFMSLQKQNGGTATGWGYGDLKVPFTNIDLGSPGKLIRGAADAMTGDNQASRLTNLEGITNQTWTDMRQIGSGPLKSFEAPGFKQAFPNTSNFPDANQGIADRMRTEAQDAASRASFITDFLMHNRGSMADAVKTFGLQQRLPTMAGGQGRAAAPKGPQIGDIDGGYVFHGGDASDPHSWSPVQQAPQPGAGGAGQGQPGGGPPGLGGLPTLKPYGQ